MPEALEVVDDPLHGRHDAAAGGPGAPDAIEEGLGEDEIARRVGGGGVDQRDIGHQGLEQPQGAERRIDDGEGLVVRHGRADQRPGHRGGQAAGGRLETLRQREDRPVLDLDLTRLVGLPEDRVGVVGGEAVARIGGHHLVDQPAPEEGPTEGAQAGHDESESRVRPPELPGQLPGGRRPTAVPHHHENGIAGPHAPRDGILERRHDGPPDELATGVTKLASLRTRNHETPWSDLIFDPNQT